jgi:hypothetical protein
MLIRSPARPEVGRTGRTTRLWQQTAHELRYGGPNGPQ